MRYRPYGASRVSYIRHIKQHANRMLRIAYIMHIVSRAYQKCIRIVYVVRIVSVKDTVHRYLHIWVTVHTVHHAYRTSGISYRVQIARYAYRAYRTLCVSCGIGRILHTSQVVASCCKYFT